MEPAALEERKKKTEGRSSNVGRDGGARSKEKNIVVGKREEGTFRRTERMLARRHREPSNLKKTPALPFNQESRGEEGKSVEEKAILPFREGKGAFTGGKASGMFCPSWEASTSFRMRGRVSPSKEEKKATSSWRRSFRKEM